MNQTSILLFPFSLWKCWETSLFMWPIYLLRTEIDHHTSTQDTCMLGSTICTALHLQLLSSHSYISVTYSCSVQLTDWNNHRPRQIQPSVFTINQVQVKSIDHINMIIKSDIRLYLIPCQYEVFYSFQPSIECTYLESLAVASSK